MFRPSRSIASSSVSYVVPQISTFEDRLQETTQSSFFLSFIQREDHLLLLGPPSQALKVFEAVDWWLGPACFDLAEEGININVDPLQCLLMC